MNKKEPLEWLLADAFQPVEPRQEYISAAKQRVLKTPPADEVTMLYMMLIGLAGFFTGLALLLILIRGTRRLVRPK